MAVENQYQKKLKNYLLTCLNINKIYRNVFDDHLINKPLKIHSTNVYVHNNNYDGV
jgi:hypothetical protein